MTVADIEVKPRYSKPRTTNKPWSRSGPGWFAKGVIKAAGRAHTRSAKALTENVLAIIPLETFRQIFPGHADVTPNEIYNRYNKGVAPKYEREHPDKHPVGCRYYRAAVEAVERGKPLSYEQIEAICKAVEDAR